LQSLWCFTAKPPSVSIVDAADPQKNSVRTYANLG
jgi:hypothetical protein